MQVLSCGFDFCIILKVKMMDETLLKRRSEIKRRLLPLEWDKKLKQINDARETELNAYRVELEKIEKEMEGGNNAEIL